MNPLCKYILRYTVRIITFLLHSVKHSGSYSGYWLYVTGFAFGPHCYAAIELSRYRVPEVRALFVSNTDFLVSPHLVINTSGNTRKQISSEYPFVTIVVIRSKKNRYIETDRSDNWEIKKENKVDARDNFIVILSRSCTRSKRENRNP